MKKGKVSGFHNWIRFYLLEKEGQVDYYSHNYDGPVRAAAGWGEAATLLVSRAHVVQRGTAGAPWQVGGEPRGGGL